jgi:hypothetical protein
MSFFNKKKYATKTITNLRFPRLSGSVKDPANLAGKYPPYRTVPNFQIRHLTESSDPKSKSWIRNTPGRVGGRRVWYLPEEGGAGVQGMSPLGGGRGRRVRNLPEEGGAGVQGMSPLGGGRVRRVRYLPEEGGAGVQGMSPLGGGRGRRGGRRC